MRKTLAALLSFGVLFAPSFAAAAALTAAEQARLESHETVIHEQTIEQRGHRYIGGITYTVLAASVAEVRALLDDVESLRRVLPRTKSAQAVGTAPGGDYLVELVHGTSLMEARYTLRVRRGEHENRFWLDPSRPHGIDDAWGFFRFEPFLTESGEEHVLLTYGVLADVGAGLLVDLFESRLRTALLSVPQLVRRQVAALRHLP